MISAKAEWRFARNQAERNALVLCGTGNPLLDGIPLAFGGDPAGTAQQALDNINTRRASMGLDAFVITNTRLSRSGE